MTSHGITFTYGSIVVSSDNRAVAGREKYTPASSIMGQRRVQHRNASDAKLARGINNVVGGVLSEHRIPPRHMAVSTYSVRSTGSAVPCGVQISASPHLNIGISPPMPAGVYSTDHLGGRKILSSCCDVVGSFVAPVVALAQGGGGVKLATSGGEVNAKPGGGVRIPTSPHKQITSMPHNINDGPPRSINTKPGRGLKIVVSGGIGGGEWLD